MTRSRAVLIGVVAVLAAGSIVERRRRTRRLSAGAPSGDPRSGVRTDDGILLHTRVDGQEHSPLAVVFAHGFASGEQEFDQLVVALQADLGAALVPPKAVRGRPDSRMGDQQTAEHVDQHSAVHCGRLLSHDHPS